jgi:16S rRNA pseudouridine516 synthase
MEPEPERQPSSEFTASPAGVPAGSESLVVKTPLVRWLTIHGAASSRKHALSLLQAGSITVNGEPCTAPAQVVLSGRDAIGCCGKAIVPYRRHRHVLLHKPRGHLTTRRAVKQLKGGGVEDDSRRTVYSLLDAETQMRHCVAVGRLDVDTTGALLFTSDGMLAHHLLGPDFHVTKLYRATLRTMEPLSAEAIAQLAAGVTLRSKKQMVCRGVAQNVPGRPGVVELQVDSGAFHQVGAFSISCPALSLSSCHARLTT